MTRVTHNFLTTNLPALLSNNVVLDGLVAHQFRFLKNNIYDMTFCKKMSCKIFKLII